MSKDTYTHTTVECFISDIHGFEWSFKADVKGEIVCDNDGLESSHPYHSHGSQFYVTHLSVYDITCANEKNGKLTGWHRPLLEDMPDYFTEQTLNEVRMLAREKLLEETLNKEKN